MDWNIDISAADDFVVSGSFGPRRSAWWKIFISTGAKYGENKTYLAAWCTGCVKAHMQRNRAYDRAEMREGMRSDIRPEEELKRLGNYQLHGLNFNARCTDTGHF